MRNFSSNPLLTVTPRLPNNKYFAAFPQNVICTEAKVGTDQFGKPAIIYKHEERCRWYCQPICGRLSMNL